mmetsp:Transcript_14112/g.10165  ORF Transcript_14112/g.10165 Transcript_14112/m.10165 type:complete len:184 (+) Transcript_14112:769-1320(+)
MVCLYDKARAESNLIAQNIANIARFKRLKELAINVKDNNIMEEMLRQAKVVRMHEFLEGLFLKSEENEVFLMQIQFFKIPFVLKKVGLSAHMCQVPLETLLQEIGKDPLVLRAEEVKFDSTRAFYATKEQILHFHHIFLEPMAETIQKATIFLHDPFNVKSIHCLSNSNLQCLNLIGTSINMD